MLKGEYNASAIFLFPFAELVGTPAAGGMELELSSKKTRKQLQRKGQKVRKQIAKTVKHKVEQV